MKLKLFISKREKLLWLYVTTCYLAILSLLFLGQPLTELFSNQNLQAALFTFGMVLVALVILLHAFRKKSGKLTMMMWLSIIAVFSMFLLRLGLPERSHLIEYSILAILIHEALLERGKKEDSQWKAPLMAVVLTSVLGVIDESLQLVVPDRFFDINDIYFNTLAAVFAVGSRVIVDFTRSKFRNPK